MVWLQRAMPFFGILLLFQMTTAAQIRQQYHHINNALTWYEARSFCRVKYADLATVNNMADMNELVQTLSNHPAYSWIGLKKGTTKRWMWSDGRGRAQFTKWADGEPNNVGGFEECAEMAEGGTWIDIVCDEDKGFVCYDRLPNGNPAYVFYSEKKNWVNSQELCRSRHTDMAYASTDEDNSLIANVATTSDENKVWTGLFKDAWVWSDGKETSFRYWLSGSQSWGDCASAVMSEKGRWIGANCQGKVTFVCQGGLKVKKMIIRMTLHSDADLTDSTVSDALLEKLETALRQESLTDFHLSWRSYISELVYQPQEQL